MTSFNRRTLIASVAAAAAPAPVLAAAAAPAPTRSLVTFAVLRNGKPFGQYTVQFDRNGGQLTVTTNVAMSARIAGLTVFDYRHRCIETWIDGVFAEMNSHSIRDNQADEEDVVRALRTTQGVRVTSKHGELLLGLDARPFTHWNRVALDGPLFNPQTGLQLRLTAATVGKDVVQMANGSRVTANHWVLRGEAQIDEWYADSGAWYGLRGTLPDRSLLEYRRV